MVLLKGLVQLARTGLRAKTQSVGNPRISQKKRCCRLLNAFDGVASQEGWLLFLMTNYVDGLDNTFTRRSCIYQRFKFRQANIDIAEKDDLVRELSDISGVQYRDKSVSEIVRTAPSMNLKDTG